MEFWITSVISSLGGGALISVLAIKWFGQKLIESQIEKGKEKLKFKIEAEFDRISKIHQKEFEVLPLLWTLLLDALGRSAYLTNPVKQQVDLERKSEFELEEFLTNSKFHESEKIAIRNSKEKNQLLLRYNILEAAFEYKRTFNEFHNCLLKNKIFLTRELYDLFSEIDSTMLQAEAICDTAVNGTRIEHKRLHEARRILNERIDPMKEKIAEEIQHRLHFHEAK